MKKLIAVCFICFMLITQTASAIEIRSDWPPVDWQVLAQGAISNVQNVGPFDIDAFTIMVGGVSVWFNPTAPFASTETFNRAFKMALLFKAMNIEVEVYGTDFWNAVSIAPLNE